LGLALFGFTAPAQGGIGLAIVLDLPAEVRVGDSNVDATLTLTNMNTDGDALSANLVFDISVTPSCGERALAGSCPTGGEDPAVFAIDPVATGRQGTACDGVVFSVAERSAASGEVIFNAPQGFIVLGSRNDALDARQCVIDFSFSLAAPPAKRFYSKTF